MPWLWHNGVEVHVPAVPCEPRTYPRGRHVRGQLPSLTQGVSPEKSGLAASFLATKVITQIGARLHHGTKHFWDECSGK